MTMVCRCCTHPRCAEMDCVLALREQSIHDIARNFGVSEDSLWRHRQNHLRALMARSEELRMLASTESLIAEMNRLHDYVREVLERGQQAGDDRLILMGVAEGRRNMDALARLGTLGEVEARLAALEAAAQPRTDAGDAGGAGDVGEPGGDAL